MGYTVIACLKHPQSCPNAPSSADDRLTADEMNNGQQNLLEVSQSAGTYIVP